MNKTTCITLLLLASALPCFAQDSTPSEPQPGALMAFEREIEAATAQGDIAFLTHALADDFTFTHGDAWRTGGKPSRVDTKKSWMEFVRVCRAKDGGWEVVSHRTVAESAT